MCTRETIMKLGSNFRDLSPTEQALALRVFGTTLPSWSRVGIDDGLGYGDRPYTLDSPPGLYILHLGPVCYPDCTSRTVWGAFGRIDGIFIHEMTHVWQYHHGYNVKLSSLWAQSAGSGYGFSSGEAWNDYNVEQQASLVAKWYVGGMSTRGVEFPYIDKVLRRGGGPGRSKPLASLQAMP
jgi:hypothetical protein